jgi:D-alanyl-lipoteichoic acid acyltransferase DltB (MBOAT superfamily)
MVFNSVPFFVFFAAFLLLYFVLQKRIFLRNLLIIVSSYFFYGWWDVRFLILVALSTSTDYCAALGASGQIVTFQDRLKAGLLLMGVAFGAVLLAHRDYWLLSLTGPAVALFLLTHFLPLRLNQAQSRKAWLVFSLVTNFGLLFIFKYFNFFVDQAVELASALGVGQFHFSLKVILPVGLSFFTFQATSRTIDSYLGRYVPAKSIVNYAAFHAFFPQLIAGPIERAAHLMPQFEMERPMTWNGVSEGVLLFLWGLFKKIVIADNVALLAEPVFGAASGSYSSGEALVAVLAFTFQIYGDFSGYSDMARGLASIMGFELMRNFDIPYVSRTPSEFWRRWHISLSQWLRDYIFIPLGGSRGGDLKTYRNLMATMILGGIWHGASWTFAFWGFYHGAIQVLFRATRLDKALERANSLSVATVLVHLALWALTFTLIMIGWVFFRAVSFAQAAQVLGAIFLWHGGPPQLLPLFLIVWPLLLVEAVETIARQKDVYLSFSPFLRFNFGLATALAVVALGAAAGQQFIYFDF